MEPIKTAGELYREIKKRGLHLRKGFGRDDSLLHELQQKLGCPDNNFQKYLDKSNFSAEDFVLIFLNITAPFARMFQEIYSYLAGEHAHSASETITIQFGFKNNKNQCKINLEQFRKYAANINCISFETGFKNWNSDALLGLFSVGDTLLGENISVARKTYEEHGRYEVERQFILPKIDIIKHEFDIIVDNIRNVFQQIIDNCMPDASYDNLTQKRNFDRESFHTQDAQHLKERAFNITDLLPIWYYIFLNCQFISQNLKNEALKLFDKNIKPLLNQPNKKIVKEALDMLELPFWRHRWHTYEIWATILTLRILCDYKPVLRKKNGYVQIDSYSSSIIADLRVIAYKNGCVAIQTQTKYFQGKRKAIKPDLRICYGDPLKKENTAGVVEFKQRRNIDSQKLIEMANSYIKGCPKSGGVLVINYDETNKNLKMPVNSYLVEGLHPFNHDKISHFKNILFKILEAAKFNALQTIILLDVSFSMRYKYDNVTFKNVITILSKVPTIKILQFNKGLLKTQESYDYKTIKTFEGTNIKKALLEIEYVYGIPNKLLIVTDGKHEQPVEILSKFPKFKECLPDEVIDNIDWLKS